MIIWGTCPVARGSMSGGRQPSASYARLNARWFRSDTAHQGTPSPWATLRILSSMSVTFRQNVTWYPLAPSQRTRMSKLTPDLMWPMCGGACTVAPHRYTDAFPGVRGVNSRTARAAVSWRRSVMEQGYGTPGPACGLRPAGPAAAGEPARLRPAGRPRDAGRPRGSRVRSVTVKLVVLYTQPSDPEAFDRHYFGTHMPLVSGIPGLERTETGKIGAAVDGGEQTYYRVTELYFADQGALQAGFG